MNRSELSTAERLFVMVVSKTKTFVFFGRPVLIHWLGGGPLGHPKIFINLVRAGLLVRDVPLY